jgi:tRNA threonylcarbamoyladenosine biosynthesis protein TsaE
LKILLLSAHGATSNSKHHEAGRMPLALCSLTEKGCQVKLFATQHRLLATATLTSLTDTDRLAAALLTALPPRAAIGLVGTLGAGKTRFARGLASAAGVAETEITSPTFTLVHRYEAARVLYHLDAYRLVDEDEFWELGVDEMFEEEAVTAIEWADRVADALPLEALWIELRLSPAGTDRQLRLTGQPDRWLRLLADLPLLQMGDASSGMDETPR